MDIEYLYVFWDMEVLFCKDILFYFICMYDTHGTVLYSSITITSEPALTKEFEVSLLH